MAQKVAYDLSRHGRTQESYGTRMPEGMGTTFAARLHSCCLQSTANFVVNPGKWAIGSTRANEDFSHVGFGTSSAKVIEQSFPHRLH